jgi:putative transferase (TIGR04331 family)
MSVIYIATRLDFSQVLQLNPTLMGLWCLPFEKGNPKIRSHISELSVLPSKEFLDDDYVRDLYVRLIPEISAKLNSLHGIRLSNLQWETILGYWLITILNPLFDRWKRIEHVSELSSKAEVLVCNRPTDFDPSLENMEDKKFGSDDYFNSYVYEKIIDYFPNIQCRQSGEPIQEVDNRSLGSKHRIETLRKKIVVKKGYFLPWVLSTFIRALFDTLFRRTRIIKKQEIFIVANWLPIRAMLKLSIKCKKIVIPNNLTFPQPKLLKSGKVLGAVVLQNFEPQSRFEEFLRLNLFTFFPSSILGDFQSQIQFIKRNNLDFTPKLTLSNLEHCTGADYVRIWFGLYGNSEGQLHILQHGGGYGQFKSHWSAFLEQRIARKFLCWGWASLSSDQTKYINIPALRLNKPNSPVARNTEVEILLLLSPELRFTSLPLPSQPYNSNLHKAYLDHISEMIGKLDKTALEKLKIRAQSSYFPMTNEYFKTHHPNISLAYEQGSPEFSSASLLISTYNGTNSLECLKSGQPTIYFWDKRYSDYTEQALPYLNELARTGVLQTDPAKAAELLNMDSSSLLTWWNSIDVQSAINSYLSKFGETEGGIEKWSSIIWDLYKHEEKRR